MCMCVYVYVCMRVCACVRACVYVRVCVRVHVCIMYVKLATQKPHTVHHVRRGATRGVVHCRHRVINAGPARVGRALRAQRPVVVARVRVWRQTGVGRAKGA